MAAPNAQPDSGPPDDASEPSPPGARGPSDAGRPDDDRPHDPEKDLDVDARWAGIVAELGELSDLGTDDGPAAPQDAQGEGTPGSQDPRRGRDVLGSVPVAPWVQPPGPRDWPTTPDVEAMEEAESHFVPPDPPLVLGRDPLLTMAWSVVVGVPVVLLVLLVVARPFPVLVAQVGGIAFLAALAVLLWRMPHRRDDDDRGPGAVV